MNLRINLSKKQSQIAGFLAAGYCKKEVARHMRISVRTVENTARNIYEKIGVHSVGQLCAWWFCKTFNIPLRLLPTISLLKTKAAALCLIVLMISNEILADKGQSQQVAKAIKVKRARRKVEVSKYRVGSL